MVTEAEANRQEDERFKQTAHTRNEADALAYQLEKTLKDLGEKLPAEDKTMLEGKVQELRDAAQGDDEPAIRAKIDDANKAFSEVSQRMYEAAGAAAGPGPGGPEGPQAGPGPAAGPGGGPQSGPGGAGPHGDVIDAEFEAEDEK